MYAHIYICMYVSHGILHDIGIISHCIIIYTHIIIYPY